MRTWVCSYHPGFLHLFYHVLEMITNSLAEAIYSLKQITYHVTSHHVDISLFHTTEHEHFHFQSIQIHIYIIFLVSLLQLLTKNKLASAGVGSRNSPKSGLCSNCGATDSMLGQGYWGDKPTTPSSKPARQAEFRWKPFLRGSEEKQKRWRKDYLIYLAILLLTFLG